MTTYEHTPGPWFVRKIDLYEGGEGVEVVAVDGEVICNNQTYYPQELDPRNASLIAAAPELLEALQNMVRLYYSEDRQDAPGQYARAAVAAIAKATGGSP